MIIQSVECRNLTREIIRAMMNLGADVSEIFEMFTNTENKKDED